MNASSKMKFIGAILIAAVMMSSCLLPSLHPIYTEETREIDDRIIGTWTIDEESALDILYDLPKATLITNKATEIDTQFISPKEVEGYDQSQSSWIFERAALITSEGYFGDKATRFAETRFVGAPSMVPEGFQLIHKEEHPFYLLTHKHIDLPDPDTTVVYINKIKRPDTITTRLLVNMTEIGGDVYLDFIPYGDGSVGKFGGNYIKAHSFAKVSLDDGHLAISMFDGDFIEELIKNRKVRLRHEKLGEEERIVLTASTAELRSFIDKYGDDPNLYDDQLLFSKL